jgi:hypothetical protein
MRQSTETGNILATVDAGHFFAVDRGLRGQFPPRRIAGFKSDVLIPGVL